MIFTSDTPSIIIVDRKEGKKMKLYSYYTNIYDNKGNPVKIVGNNKATIEKAFKYFNVKVGERSKSKVNPYLVSKYKNIDEVLEAQKEILSWKLKLKQCIIKDEVYKVEKITD